MNQEKIGKFIAKLRKEKNMTQQELADMLNVTDRAVSHWENGRCLPDISLFKSICEIFNISINELISGEKITKENYKEESDNNILNVITTTEKKNVLVKRKYKIFIMISITIIVINILIFFLTKKRYEQSEIESITVFGEKIDVIKNKKVYKVYMKSATIKKRISNKECVKPIEVKYKNGKRTKEWAFRYNEGDEEAYLYSTTDETYSERIMDNIDNSSIYYVGAYDVYIEVHLDEPLHIDESCKFNK
ncbi:MAG: helix-turn-helix transcriptional regulator [Bacilli bacterium]|nr:helix-turn-helix transcriptional regulator [Bacilli bacterium]